MNIAYILPMTWTCGGIIASFMHVNGLAARGHRIAVFAPEGSEAGWFPLAVPVLPFPNTPPGPDAAFDAAVYVGDTFSLCDRFPACSEYLFLQSKDHLWVPISQRERLLRGYLDPRFRILAVSRWLADFARERCNNPRVDVIHNGIDPGRFFPNRESRQGFRILVEGNFPDRVKNVLHAIEIARRVRQFHPVEIWAMGRRFESAGGLVDRVIENPPQDAIPDIYRQCDLIIKTSIMEGFGLPHLEAMACGCIPVSYASGGVTDFCRHEENSLLAGVGNIPSMVGHVLRFLGDSGLRARLMAGALATARSMTWSRTADSLEAVFRRDCGEAA